MIKKIISSFILFIFFAGFAVSAQAAADPVRIEDDFNLAYQEGKSDELVAYLKAKYVDDQSFVRSLGPDFSSTYGDENFTDVYFDTSKLDLYSRKAGLRYRTRVNRLDPENRKSGRELVQLKLSGGDKFSDQAETTTRNEIKFDVERVTTPKTADDRNPVLSLITPSARDEFKTAAKELNINVSDLRPILTITQRRRRVYLNRGAETFISFSMDDVRSRLWWSSASFSQMEVELNELAYTGASEADRLNMRQIRHGMIDDLRGHYAYLQDDSTIKYTKTFDLLVRHLPFARFLIKIGLLHG